MKTLGIVLVIIGGLMVMSGLRLALTEYDLSDTNDISKASGGIGFSVAMIAVGGYLAFGKSGKGKD
ncbi:hypothetical protein Pan97_22900 [Bremerella volcania]|uniref:Uncharacterized protein n=1 Tax=Bremerella volcania TaxID=2527984 RepID=A0A518C7T1_9BACT|nr:hypothetical protein [Bremerella volcania]QDU75260.1 hypothetical protein Pan97_22900 [Bremerella volcania]